MGITRRFQRLACAILAISSLACIAPAARAETEFLPEVPDDLSYEQARPDAVAESRAASDLESIDRKLAAEGLIPIDPSAPLFAAGVAAPQIRAYSDAMLERFAFVLPGIHVSRQDLLSKALYHPDGYLFHGKLAESGIEYALFATDIGIPGFSRVVASDSASARARRWFVSLLDRIDPSTSAEAGPGPHGQDPGYCTARQNPAPAAATRISTDAQKAANAPRKDAAEWWRCPWGAAQGAWNATGGVVVAAGKLTWTLIKGTWKLITQPRTFWHETSEHAKAIGEFFKHFSIKDLFGSAKDKFNKKSQGEKVETICKIATEAVVGIGVSGLIAFRGATLANKLVALYKESDTYRKIVDSTKALQWVAEKGAAKTAAAARALPH